MKILLKKQMLINKQFKYTRIKLYMYIILHLPFKQCILSHLKNSSVHSAQIALTILII